MNAACVRLAIAVISLGVGGCRHAAPPAPAGFSDFRFVQPASPPATGNPILALPENTPTPMISPATPILPLRQPVYPARALAARAGFAMVGVRVTVGPDGHVAAVDSSLAAWSTLGPWADEFRTVVEAAVKEWRFRPARIVVVERIKDAEGQDDAVVRRSEPTEWVLDVLFTFTEEGTVMARR